MSSAAIEALEHRDAGAAIRRLATPNALALIGDQLLGIVDTIAIGSLGTAALAGTSLPIDRVFVRKELGFDSVAANSTVVGIPARAIFKKSDIGQQASDNTIGPASATRAASS